MERICIMGKKNICMILDDTAFITEIISTIIQSYFDLEIHIFHEGARALEFYKKNKEKIALITSDYNMPEMTGGEFFLKLREINPELPFVLISAEPLDILEEFKGFKNDQDFYYINKPFQSDVVIDKVKKSMRLQMEYDDTRCIGIDIDKILKYEDISQNFDFYLKLSSGKTIKISQEGDALDSTRLYKYKAKGLEQLYLSEPEFKKYTGELISKFADKLTDKNVDLGEKVYLKLSSIELVHETLKTLGVSEILINLTDKMVESTLSDIKKSSELKKLISQILENKNYIYSHSILTSYIASILGNKINWCDEKQISKLLYASFFKDIALNLPKQFSPEIFDISSETFKKLPFNERMAIKDHPIDGLKMLENYKDLPSDVLNIISLHHEIPGGNGYPRQVPPQAISPLACIFIFASDFAHNIITKGVGPKSCKEIKDHLTQNYSIGYFKNILKVCLDSILKNK